MVTQLARPEDSGTRPVVAGTDGRRRHPRPSRVRRGRVAPNYVRRWRIEVALGAVVLVVVATSLTIWPAPAPARVANGADLTRSGIVMADAFDRPVSRGQLMDHYVFNGSAAPGVGWARATARGLQVGVTPHPGWAGWFAVTLDAAGPGVIWHTEMSRPLQPARTGEGEAVFAVQTATTQHSGAINYVVVSALSTHGEGEWLVGYAHGVIANADTDVLWRSPLRVGAPTTEPVTIRTDGRRTLAVWLGTRRVYASDRLRLDVPAPFQAYLEVQSRQIGYVASFQDFWVADASPVTVTGVPPGARVRLGSGARLATATAGRDGTASLVPAPPTLVGTGALTVAGSGRRRDIAHLPYAGGDVWHLTGG
ncbi:MAG TPA: hypothetical protein VN796_06225 [Acidimicrobiales bacterium]|nr:hypothetical protein [Acidimicrobiales bacterium]